MVTRTLPDDIGDWRILGDNLKPLLEKLPHLSGQHAELEQAIAEALRLEAKQEVAIARLREINAQRAAVQERGQEIRRRIAHALRGHFRGTNVELLQFGIKPLRGGPRSKKTRSAKPPPEPAT
ncbi:MAG TPA: hypothetical protein VF121_15330 [Thermoanaerobaculia bacterium]|nr:hypothetical protein [Thermoanaerobaculia bacterium]